MTSVQCAVVVISIIPTLVWLAALGATLRSILAIDVLADVDADTNARDTWPLLSVISPACNEEASIRASLESTLNQDYPSLEVIAVDDRSTDGTGAELEVVAASDVRVKVARIDALPEGWLGKLNALAKGIERAEGEWLLFADADVMFSPETLREAVAYCEARGLDYLSVLPEIETAGFAADTVFNVAGVLMCLGARPWAVRDASDDASLGSGALIMVRRAAYERSPGLSWMRLEVADDQAVCLLIKSHGGRCDVVNARGRVRLQWYEDFGEMREKMQKNFYGIMARFSLGRAVGLSALLVWLAVSPLLALYPGLGGWRWVPLVGWGALTLATLLSSGWTRRPLGPACAPSMGLLLTVYLLLRSAWVGHRRGGIEWRGVWYPSELLRDAQRIKL